MRDVVIALLFCSLTAALTQAEVTYVTDGRSIYAEASVVDGDTGEENGSDEHSPLYPPEPFGDWEESQAFEGTFRTSWFSGDAAGSADQTSSMGPSFIQMSANTAASASMGSTQDGYTDSAVGRARSVLDVTFSVDQSQPFALSGVLHRDSADIYDRSEVFVRLASSDDTLVLVDETLEEGTLTLSSSGELAPGEYRFQVFLEAFVLGAGVKGPFSDEATAEADGVLLEFVDGPTPVVETSWSRLKAAW